MIHLATAWKGGDDWKRLAEITTGSFRSYAAKHGYGFHCHEGEYGTHESYLFQRVDFMRHILTETEGLTYLWMLDIDNLITNEAITLEPFVNLSHVLYIAKDINGINGGSLILRHSDLANEWCNALMDLSKTSEGENHAMILLDNGADRRFHDHTRFVPEINKIPYERYPVYGRQDHPSQWSPGSLVCHLPGMTPAARIKIFREIEE